MNWKMCKSVQLRNYSYETGSMTGILEELKWETLQKRRKNNRLILLYKGLKGKSNRKAMNRNRNNQKANPALKTKAGNKQILQIDKIQ